MPSYVFKYHFVALYLDLKLISYYCYEFHTYRGPTMALNL